MEHRVIRIDLRAFGGSALTDDIAVPKSRPDHEISSGIPITYVPARNTIFLAFALYAFETLANLATKAGVEGRTRLRVHAPLLRLSKADIVRLAGDLGVDFSLTHSCYDPDAAGRPCGHCDSCVLRKRGFAEAGIADPLNYRA